MADVRIEGLDDVKRRLLLIPKEMLRSSAAPVGRGLRAMGEVFAQEAQNRAPMHTGTLKRSIVVRKAPRRKTRRGTMRYMVGVDERKAFYGYMVEYGTGHGGPLGKGKARGGFIKPRKARVLAHGNKVFGAKVKGQRAQPFMRPAAHAKRPQAVRAFVDAYNKRLDALVKKVSKL